MEILRTFYQDETGTYAYRILNDGKICFGKTEPQEGAETVCHTGSPSKLFRYLHDCRKKVKGNVHDCDLTALTARYPWFSRYDEEAEQALGLPLLCLLNRFVADREYALAEKILSSFHLSEADFRAHDLQKLDCIRYAHFDKVLTFRADAEPLFGQECTYQKGDDFITTPARRFYVSPEVKETLMNKIAFLKSKYHKLSSGKDVFSLPHFFMDFERWQPGWRDNEKRQYLSEKGMPYHFWFVPKRGEEITELITTADAFLTRFWFDETEICPETFDFYSDVPTENFYDGFGNRLAGFAKVIKYDQYLCRVAKSYLDLCDPYDLCWLEETDGVCRTARERMELRNVSFRLLSIRFERPVFSCPSLYFRLRFTVDGKEAETTWWPNLEALFYNRAGNSYKVYLSKDQVREIEKAAALALSKQWGTSKEMPKGQENNPSYVHFMKDKAELLGHGVTRR